MGLSMFIQTCGKIARNPGVPTLTGLARHSVWHLARRVCPLPMRVALTAQSALQLQRRSELNGCVALAWSQRLYDYNNMSFIRELTRQGVAQVCMDVGSNIGPYALIMSEQKQTRVLCFEPHPETFTVLNRVLRSNGRDQVTAFNVALSDREGELSFTDGACNPGNRVLTGGETGGAITVPALTGQSFCQREQVQPDLLKIDTEGHEPEVLRGFGAVLSKVKVLILEENDAPEVIAGCLPQGTFLGPLYVDFTARRFTREKQWAEDAVYLNRTALPELERLGFRVEGDAAVQAIAGKGPQPE